jgi:hypothetical protein
MSNATATTDQVQEITKLRRYWLADNVGQLARVAEEFGRSKTFVGAVYWGRVKSRNFEIENRFAELGVPGFEPQR